MKGALWARLGTVRYQELVSVFTFCCSLTKHHGHKQLKEKRICFRLLFQEEKRVHNSPEVTWQPAARAKDWEITSPTTNTKQSELETRLQTLKPISSDTFPPVRLHLVKVPGPSQIVPPTGGQVLIPNSATYWRSGVHRCEPMRDIPHSNQNRDYSQLERAS